MSARLSARGCSAARTDATTTSGALARPRLACRRSASRRRPTISALGLSRSCGSVSQAGNSTISASGSQAAERGAELSDSRPVAVTTSSACGQPASARLLEQAREQRGAEPVGEREVGVARRVREGVVERGGARKRRMINPEVITRPSLRRAPDTAPARACAESPVRRAEPLRTVAVARARVETARCCIRGALRGDVEGSPAVRRWDRRRMTCGTARWRGGEAPAGSAISSTASAASVAEGRQHLALGAGEVLAARSRRRPGGRAGGRCRRARGAKSAVRRSRR